MLSWFLLYLAKKLNFGCSSMYAFELCISYQCFGFQIVAKASKNCILQLLQSLLNMAQKTRTILITYVKDTLRVILTEITKYYLRDHSILLLYTS